MDTLTESLRQRLLEKVGDGHGGLSESYRDLALAIGVPHATLHRFLRGVGVPSGATLDAVADYLGVQGNVRRAPAVDAERARISEALGALVANWRERSEEGPFPIDTAYGRKRARLTAVGDCSRSLRATMARLGLEVKP